MAPTSTRPDSDDDLHGSFHAQPCYSCQWSGAFASEPVVQQTICSEGWNAFRVFAAGASGPRAFVTMGFDVLLLSLIRQGALYGPKWFLGGSTAALRHCALLASSLMPADRCLTHDLKEHFVGMVFKPGDTPETLAPMMDALYRKVLPPEHVEGVIGHPSLHLCIMVTQILPPYDDMPEWQLRAMFWFFLGANFISSRALAKFQKRLCFYTGPCPPPFILEEEEVECLPLTATNIYQVLRATTCLPFISPHCHLIEGVGPGLFFDGALGNYHLNLRSCPGYPVLLLGDGPGPEFKQTLWDAYVPFRTAPPEYCGQVSVLYPTTAFVEKQLVPRLPDTFDYFKDQYVREPELRHRHWRHCYDTSLQHFPMRPCHLLPGHQHEADVKQGEHKAASMRLHGSVHGPQQHKQQQQPEEQQQQQQQQGVHSHKGQRQQQQQQQWQGAHCRRGQRQEQQQQQQQRQLWQQAKGEVNGSVSSHLNQMVSSSSSSSFSDVEAPPGAQGADNWTMGTDFGSGGEQAGTSGGQLSSLLSSGVEFLWGLVSQIQGKAC